MRIAIGSDHAGLPLKDPLVSALRAEGHDVLDLGTNTPDPVDYPDYAAAVGQAILTEQADRGIILCGSAIGASIAANKIHGIRAGVCHDTYSAHQGVEHDNANVLCLGARIIGASLALEVAHAFVHAQFTGEDRHRRRLAKIAILEATGVPTTAIH